MAKNSLWLSAAVAFALTLCASSAGWCLPSSPTPATSGNGVNWGDYDGTQSDFINPSGSNGAISPNFIVVKTSNQVKSYQRVSPSQGYFQNPTAMNDYQVLSLVSNVHPLAGSSQPSSSLNPPGTANRSRVYYDPDGPANPPSGCNSGGRWLLISAAKNTSSGAHGILIASTKDTDANSDGTPNQAANWAYQAFIPCSSTSGCTDNLQLGWNANFIAITVDDWNGTGTASLISLSHDSFECGSTGYTGTLSSSNYAVVTNNTVLQGACPASGYRNTALSGSSNDFNNNFLYVIADYNQSTSHIVVSNLQAGVSGSPNGKFNIGSTLPISGQTISSWALPPSNGSPQSGSANLSSPPNVNLSPTNLRFTSCMFRSGGVWGAETVGVSGSSPPVVAAQWFEVGQDAPLTGTGTGQHPAGYVWVQGLFGGGTTTSGGSSVTSDNVTNSSIAANTNCVANLSNYSGGPTCDVLLGFTDIPPSGSGAFMSTAYLFNPNNTVQEDLPEIYTAGAGMDPYAGCSNSSGSYKVVGIATGPYTGTTIDPQSQYSSSTHTPSTYPADTDFFSAANGALNTANTNCTTDAKEWGLTFAEVPNTD